MPARTGRQAGHRRRRRRRRIVLLRRKQGSGGRGHRLVGRRAGGFGRGCRHKSSASRFGANGGNGFLLPGAKPHYAPDLMIVPTHKEIHLDCTAIGSKTLAGAVTVHFECRHLTEGRKVLLDAVAFAQLEVVSLEAHRPLTYRYDGKKVQIVWADAFEAVGEVRRVRVMYTVQDPVAGMHFFSPRSPGIEAATYMVSDHETEKARYWLPCVDLPTVRTTAEFHLTTWAADTGFANGVLVSETDLPLEAGDAAAGTDHRKAKKLTVWRLDFPCPSYLLCVAAGELISVDDTSEAARTLMPETPIAYIAPKGVDPALLLQSFGPTPTMLHWISEKLGQPFPFPKYYQVMGDQHESAMENISLVSWGLNWLQDQHSLREYREVMNSINVHEIGHSFFGDSLVIKHFEHAWLKESWATYVECCWLEDHEGRDAFLYQIYNDLRSYATEVEEDYARPIVTRTYNSSWSMYDDHLYPGGSCRLHMLRHQLGDGVFWKAVREYVARNMRGIVETADFRKVLEEVSGRSLVQFFEQWLYTPGFPELTGEWDYDEETRVVTLTVSQGEEDEDGGGGGYGTDDDEAEEEAPLLDVSFLVEVYDAKGEKLAAMRPALTRTTRKVIITAAVARQPSYLHVNPGLATVMTLDLECEEEVLGNTARKAADLPSRIWAYAQLIHEVGTPSAMALVRKHIRDEPFYGARVAVAESLSDAPSKAAAEILSEMLGREEDPRALYRIAEACGAFRHAALRSALLDLWEKEREGRLKTLYRAKAEVLASIGAQNDARDLPLLLQVLKAGDAANERGPNDFNDLETNIVRSGAMTGLSFIHDDGGAHAALAYLESRLVGCKEKQLPVRIAVVEAYARAAGHAADKALRQKAARTLAELALLDECRRLGETAASALIDHLPQEALYYSSELSAFRHRLPAQEHFSLDRQLRDLEEENEEATPLQKLRRRMRRWEERVGRWEESLEEHVKDAEVHGRGGARRRHDDSGSGSGTDDGSSSDSGSDSSDGGGGGGGAKRRGGGGNGGGGGFRGGGGGMGRQRRKGRGGGKQHHHHHHHHQHQHGHHGRGGGHAGGGGGRGERGGQEAR